MSELVLGLFSGIGLLDSGFERAGYCVVRGPDLIYGGDVRSFNPPAGKFDGVIGGPPCQDFSKARGALAPTGDGLAMLNKFVRCVEAAQPVWWLMENVSGVPDVQIDGYSWQRLDLYANEFGVSQRRLRHIQFGSNDGTALVRHSSSTKSTGQVTPTILATDDTPISEMAVQQGLDPSFDIPPFTRAALRRAMGNGVPAGMASALASMVRDRGPAHSVRLCGCGCGRVIGERKTFAGGTCRMRVHRRKA